VAERKGGAFVIDIRIEAKIKYKDDDQFGV
jgi:shikimate kinase